MKAIHNTPKTHAALTDEDTLIVEADTRSKKADYDNLEAEIKGEPNYTIRDENGNVVTENADLATYMRHLNKLRSDSYAIQELIDIRQSILDGQDINNTIDYYRTFRKYSGMSYGSFQAKTDYNLQKIEQDLNEAINKMRKSVYSAFDWLYNKAEQGNGFAIAGCATLGGASFTLPRTMVSNFIQDMAANRRQRKAFRSSTEK